MRPHVHRQPLVLLVVERGLVGLAGNERRPFATLEARARRGVDGPVPSTPLQDGHRGGRRQQGRGGAVGEEREPGSERAVRQPEEELQESVQVGER